MGVAARKEQAGVKMEGARWVIAFLSLSLQRGVYEVKKAWPAAAAHISHVTFGSCNYWPRLTWDSCRQLQTGGPALNKEWNSPMFDFCALLPNTHNKKFPHSDVMSCVCSLHTVLGRAALSKHKSGPGRWRSPRATLTRQKEPYQQCFVLVPDSQLCTEEPHIHAAWLTCKWASLWS